MEEMKKDMSKADILTKMIDEECIKRGLPIFKTCYDKAGQSFIYIPVKDLSLFKKPSKDSETDE